MAHIRVCYAFLELDEPARFTATQLRGFLGNLFVDDVEFHHHLSNPYHYPLVQYKMINDQPMIMGFGEYADMVFRRVSGIEKLVIKARISGVRSIDFRQELFAIGGGQKNYRFVSPWIALNEKNYRTFLEAESEVRATLLEKILIGNTLSMLKGLGILIDYRLNVKLTQAFPFLTRAHGKTFWGFLPEFTANIDIPRYAGLGKSVSKGFGTVDIIDS